MASSSSLSGQRGMFSGDSFAPGRTSGGKFEVERYDGRSDYLLWERQVENVLVVQKLGVTLRP